MDKCIFVFLLVNKLFRKFTLALICRHALAFFPIHIEAVAWIKSRDELIVCFVYPCCLIMFRRL